jgi:glycosyltransferase involved in cell wall biosynthesis
MMPEAMLISVVIVTWNRRDDVLRAIESIYSQAWRPVEIIVVDNGSTDGTAEAITSAYPEVRLLRMEQNLGASGGRNPGIAAARATSSSCWIATPRCPTTPWLALSSASRRTSMSGS